jgi:acetaldehyde dehydrogenase/alcohol dehydrogenase
VAQAAFARFSQEQIDEVVQRFALSVHTHALELARLAVEETRMGKVEDKILKNKVKAELIYRDIAHTPSRGIIARDEARGIIEIAEPIGVVCAVTPSTNPIVTPMCNAMIALKGGNAVIFAPHPRAKRCVARTVELLQKDIAAIGAPDHLLQVITEPSLDTTQELMAKCDLTIATGGSSMVKAAYGSGKPAYGVGPGNVPVLVDVSATPAHAVRDIMKGKTFDNGLICASEQAVIALPDNAELLKREFQKQGAYLVPAEEKPRLEAVMFEDGHPTAEIVGAFAPDIAALADIDVPPETRVLLVEETETGHDAPFSLEKISPVLAFYAATDFAHGVQIAADILEAGGKGHTAGIHSEDDARIEQFAQGVAVSRVIINQPTATAAGGSVNNNLVPTTTLGCGTWGGNITTDNISVEHVMNVKRVAYNRPNVRSYRTLHVPAIVHGVGALSRLRDVEAARAVILTDSTITRLGFTTRISQILADSGKEVQVLDTIPAEPTIDDVYRGRDLLLDFEPDLLVAVGGGSCLAAAKAIWVFYEHPELALKNVASVPVNIYTRIEPIPRLGHRAQLIAVPTTSGTGSEVSGIALIRDAQSAARHTLFSHHMIPTEAILDPTLTYSMSAALAAKTGMEALAHGLEAFVARNADPISKATARESVQTIYDALPRSVDGSKEARNAVHVAATSAGIASQNAGLGLANALAAQVSAALDLSYGTACAVLLPTVIRYNRDDPDATAAYADLADTLGGGDDLAAMMERFAQTIGLPTTLADAGHAPETVEPLLDDIAAQSYLSKHTDTNPRDVDIAHLRAILEACLDGPSTLPTPSTDGSTQDPATDESDTATDEEVEA